MMPARWCALLAASGLLLSGCRSTTSEMTRLDTTPRIPAPVPTLADLNPGVTVQAVTGRLSSAVVVSPPPPPKPVTVSWNAPEGDTTGIMSTTNLAGPWRTETAFPRVAVTNSWQDTNPAPVKFYRAFSE